jgi:hypothetical protein
MGWKDKVVKQPRQQQAAPSGWRSKAVPSPQPSLDDTLRSGVKTAVDKMGDDRAGMAELEGFGQAATLGHLAQLQAAAQPTLDRIGDIATGENVSDESTSSKWANSLSLLTPGGVAKRLYEGATDDGYVERRDENLRRQRENAQANPIGSMAGKALGMAATIPVGGVPSSLGRAAAQGAVQGALYNPGDTEGEVNPLQAKDRGLAALLGAGYGTAGYGASKMLEKAGDVGMQLAVGRKKYTPGVGKQLADEGLWGTRGMMSKQAASKLTDAYEDMYTVAQTANPIDARRLGSEIYDEASGPLTGRGTIMVSDRDRPAIEAISNFADDVKSRGMETPTQALARRRAAGSSAYSMKSGDPKQTQVAQLSKMEQQKYSNALKASDQTGKLAEADARYAALKRAERSLNEEPSLSGMGWFSRPISALGGALPTSVASQAAVKGGKLINASTPLTLESWLEGLRKK